MKRPNIEDYIMLLAEYCMNCDSDKPQCTPIQCNGVGKCLKVFSTTPDKVLN